MPSYEYKKQDTTTGKLRTPVVFYEYGPGTGPEPGEDQKKRLYSCFAEAYNPSIKDLSILDTKGTKEAVTIRIRDPGKDYIPNNKHSAELEDYRYTGKVFSVVDVRPDLTNNRFITILLGVTS